MKEYHENGGTPKLRLADFSERDEYWGQTKRSNRVMASIQAKGEVKQRNRAENAFTCSDLLTFGRHTELTTQEKRLKLRHARFCKGRLCPICQRRRSMVWAGRMHRAFPVIREKYPGVRFLHLVVTVKNCPVEELRETLAHISESFNRLKTRFTKSGIMLGFIRSVEVSREMEPCDFCGKEYRKRSTCDNREDHVYTDFCHPHVHVLIAVPSTYFNGNYYMTHEDWKAAWKKALKADYDPVVSIQVVKPRKGVDSVEDALAASVKEVVKYCVKLDKEFFDHIQGEAGEKWFLELDRQISGTRAIGLGGIFKEVLKDHEPDEKEMITASEENEDELLGVVEEYWQFSYNGKKHDYYFKKILEKQEGDDFEKAGEEMKEKAEKKAKAKAEVARNKREKKAKGPVELASLSEEGEKLSKALAGGELKAKTLKRGKMAVGTEKLRKLAGMCEIMKRVS